MVITSATASGVPDSTMVSEMPTGGSRVGFQPSVEPAWTDGARCTRVQVSRSMRTLALRRRLVAGVRQRHMLGASMKEFM